MAALRVFGAKPRDRLRHHGQRRHAQPIRLPKTAAQRARHQASVAPARVGFAHAAHVVMCCMGLI